MYSRGEGRWADCPASVMAREAGRSVSSVRRRMRTEEVRDAGRSCNCCPVGVAVGELGEEPRRLRLELRGVMLVRRAS